MSIYDSKLWIEDIDEVIKTIPWLEEISGKSVMITGICGLICSAVADILIRYNEAKDGRVTILAAARSERKLRDRFGEYADRPYFIFVPYDATRLELKAEKKADYIIHGAGNAFPEMFMKEPVETMMSNFMGLFGLLEYGRRTGTRRLLYISSSEVYGKKDSSEPYREGQYGYIDLLNPRNSYSVGKRAAETLCASYTDEYGIETVIVRPGHIYGPTASPADNRVSSAWAWAVARGEDIVMKSDGAQLRSYCYCLDCASAALKVLLKGESLHAYNISNPDSVINILEMAEILAKSAGVALKMELPTEIERKGFNPMNNSSLDSSELLALGWKGLFDAERGLNHTVEIIKEIISKKGNKADMWS